MVHTVQRAFEDLLASITLQVILWLVPLFEPFVLDHLLSRQTLGLITVEHLLDQIFGVCRDIVPLRIVEGQVLVLDSVYDFLVVLTEERRTAAQQYLENDTTAPDVALEGVLLAQYFGSHLVGRAQHFGQLLVLLKLHGCTEIDYLDVHGLLAGLIVNLVHQHYVFWFEISMHYFVFMHLIDASYDLHQYGSCIRL